MASDVLAIIPCYNEEECLKIVVEDLKEKTASVDFIVINDGSSDGTYKVCIDNNYPVINFPFNLGLANAIQAGMRYAYRSGYNYALQFDGDGQHLPEYIPEMIRHMHEGDLDIVIGSRYMDKNSRGLRGLGVRFLRIAIWIATRKKLYDPTSGLRLFNRKMIGRFAKHMNYGPEPDTLVYLMNQGAKVLEVPVAMRERLAGESYFSTLIAARYMLRMFVSIIIIQWFRGKEI